MSTYQHLQAHLEKLRAFQAVATSGSLSLAAEGLHVSQAALSHSIKTLEEALNTPLFIRQPRGMVLTNTGALLFDFATRLAADVQSIASRLDDPFEVFRGVSRGSRLPSGRSDRRGPTNA